MLYDNLNKFADNFDIGQSTGTFLLTNQIDLGAANVDIGDGEPVYAVFSIDEAVTSGTSSTVDFQIRSDDTASIHATTSTLHASTGAMAHTLLTLGTQFFLPLPGGSAVPYERYLGCQAVVGSATTTAGTVSAYLTKSPPTNIRSYSDQF